MEITSLTFDIKDVITIVIGISSFTGFYYALRRSVEKVSNDLDVLEAKQKREMDTIINSIAEQKNDMHTSEELIYKRIGEIKAEQKLANEKLESKIDKVATHLSKIDTSLAELTGYIKAIK